MASEDIPGLKKFPGTTEFPWHEISWRDARDTFIDAVESLSLTQSLLLFGGALSLLVLALIVRRKRVRSPNSASYKTSDQNNGVDLAISTGVKICRWKKDRWRHGSIRFDRWICRECGVEAFSHDGRPPKECKRHLRNVTL